VQVDLEESVKVELNGDGETIHALLLL